MKISNSFKKYFLVFFLCGQSSWIISVGRCGRVRFIRVLPTIVYFVATAMSTYSTLDHFRKLSSGRAKTDGTIVCFVYFLSLLFSIVTVFNVFFFNREMSQLIQIFDQTVNHLQRSSDKTFIVESCKFKRVYLKKCALIFTIFAFQLITKVVTQPLRFGRPMHINALICIINFYQNVAKVHISLYVDLLLWCYKLNADEIKLGDGHYDWDVSFTECRLKNQLKCVINVNEYIDKLRHCKYVHFKLWKISQLINSHFGGRMMILLLNSFIDGLMSSFWLFLHLREANYRNLIRQYKRKSTKKCIRNEFNLNRSR